MASLKIEYISRIGTSATQTVLERAEGKQSSLSTTTLKCKRATSLVGLRPLWNLRSKNRRLPRTTSSCCCPTPPHWTPPALGLCQAYIRGRLVLQQGVSGCLGAQVCYVYGSGELSGSLLHPTHLLSHCPCVPVCQMLFLGTVTMSVTFLYPSQTFF